jgi:hypothetical protein
MIKVFKLGELYFVPMVYIQKLFNRIPLSAEKDKFFKEVPIFANYSIEPSENVRDICKSFTDPDNLPFYIKENGKLFPLFVSVGKHLFFSNIFNIKNHIDADLTEGCIIVLTTYQFNQLQSLIKNNPQSRL